MAQAWQKTHDITYAAFGNNEGRVIWRAAELSAPSNDSSIRSKRPAFSDFWKSLVWCDFCVGRQKAVEQNSAHGGHSCAHVDVGERRSDASETRAAMMRTGAAL